MASLTDSWTLGGLRVPNRVALAPLAGIGNWFVRLQAKRYGAGLAVSEMVSSFGIHHGNERTCREMLRLHPDERTAGTGGPTAIQLFGQDPEVMRSAAARAAAAGFDLIDLNMGCPVPKVCKTGAGAALLADPDRAVAVARAAREGGGLPVTVKLRSGRTPGDRSGVALAHRLVDEAGVAGIAFHPRHAAQHHKGTPDYELAARLVDELPAPVMISGGLRDAEHARRAFEQTGAAAILLARGSLGNPWLFEQLLGRRDGEPTTDEVLDEFNWVQERAVEHLGAERAGRYLRKFYPWYAERLYCAAFRHRTDRRRQMPRDVILTKEGLEKLKADLDLLSTEKRREVAERIKEAREFGDIMENAEYDDAKNEQAMLEAKIAQLEEKLRAAQVVSSKDLGTDIVRVGSIVHVKDEKSGKSVKYTIVGSAEAKPAEMKLSNESPVGKALLGHKRGETVEVPVPRGPKRKLKITKIDVGV